MKKDHYTKHLRTFILTALILTSATLLAQDEQDIKLNQTADTLNDKIENLRSDLDLIKKFKISGYIQPQFQVAQSPGINSFAGGKFPKNADTRFSIRRGRLKFAYNGGIAQFVLQFDATEKGFALKDAYTSLKDPWLHTFTLTGGVFNRPFGFEIGYSSTLRETPERSRIMQTLFPGERDLGAMLTINPAKESGLNFLKLDLALVCGNGVALEIDSRKDFIGHLSLNRTTGNEKFKYGIGVSYYNGGYYQETKYVYNMATLPDGMTKGFVADSTGSNQGGYAKREYLGADVQFSVDWFPGITTLRAEYIQGKQPGTATSNISPFNRVIPDVPNTDTYNRPARGGYVYFIQNIGQSRHAFVIKYDWFDPNTDVKGSEMTSAITVNGQEISTNLGGADIMYTTWGFGYNLRITENLKMMAYYDLVKNETADIKNFNEDIKDNVFTLRLQFKF